MLLYRFWLKYVPMAHFNPWFKEDQALAKNHGDHFLWNRQKRVRVSTRKEQSWEDTKLSGETPPIAAKAALKRAKQRANQAAKNAARGVAIAERRQPMIIQTRYLEDRFPHGSTAHTIAQFQREQARRIRLRESNPEWQDVEANQRRLADADALEARVRSDEPLWPGLADAEREFASASIHLQACEQTLIDAWAPSAETTQVTDREAPIYVGERLACLASPIYPWSPAPPHGEAAAPHAGDQFAYTRLFNDACVLAPYAPPAPGPILALTPAHALPTPASAPALAPPMPALEAPAPAAPAPTPAPTRMDIAAHAQTSVSSNQAAMHFLHQTSPAWNQFAMQDVTALMSPLVPPYVRCVEYGGPSIPMIPHDAHYAIPPKAKCNSKNIPAPPPRPPPLPSPLQKLWDDAMQPRIYEIPAKTTGKDAIPLRRLCEDCGLTMLARDSDGFHMLRGSCPYCKHPYEDSMIAVHAGLVVRDKPRDKRTLSVPHASPVHKEMPSTRAREPLPITQGNAKIRARTIRPETRSSEPPPRPCDDVSCPMPKRYPPGLDIYIVGSVRHEGDDVDQTKFNRDGTRNTNYDIELKRRHERDLAIEHTLKRGRSAEYRSSGNSLLGAGVESGNMCRYIPIEAVRFPKDESGFESSLKERDIVFCQVQPSNKFFAHMIHRIQWWIPDQRYYYVISGSARGAHANGWCYIDTIYGLMTHTGPTRETMTPNNNNFTDFTDPPE